MYCKRTIFLYVCWRTALHFYLITCLPQGIMVSILINTSVDKHILTPGIFALHEFYMCWTLPLSLLLRCQLVWLLLDSWLFVSRQFGYNRDNHSNRWAGRCSEQTMCWRLRKSITVGSNRDQNCTLMSLYPLITHIIPYRPNDLFLIIIHYILVKLRYPEYLYLLLQHLPKHFPTLISHWRCPCPLNLWRSLRTYDSMIMAP